jgi:hypothetical protein
MVRRATPGALAPLELGEKRQRRVGFSEAKTALPRNFAKYDL